MMLERGSTDVIVLPKETYQLPLYNLNLSNNDQHRQYNTTHILTCEKSSVPITSATVDENILVVDNVRKQLKLAQCLRDPTESNSNRSHGLVPAHSMDYKMGQASVNLSAAANKFLLGKFKALNDMDDSDSDSTETAPQVLPNKHIQLDRFNCSYDSHSNYDLEQVQLSENFMLRGPNVLEACDPARQTDESSGDAIEAGKRGIGQVYEGDQLEKYLPEKKPRLKYRPSRPPLLPPCRVCGDRASGFHYGVNTCEACKGFFRRSICKDRPYVCTGNGDCKPTAGKRTACSFCRFRRCIDVGMSKNAIKTGRYTHELRSKNILEVKRLQKQNGEDFNGHHFVSTSESSSPCHVTSDDVRYLEQESLKKRKILMEETLELLLTGQKLLYEQLDEYYDENLMQRRQLSVFSRYSEKRKERDTVGRVNGYNYNSLNTQSAQHDVIDLTVTSGLDSDVTNDRCQNSQSNTNINGSAQNSQNGVHLSKYFLNTNIKQIMTSVEETKAEVMSHILKDMEQGVNGMLAFSNSIPGFPDLNKDDKAALLKTARFDVWYVGHVRCFNAELRVGACEWQFHADELAQVWGGDLVDLSFRMARQGQLLDLNKEQTAALRAVCLTMPDRCAPLENPLEVEQMNDLMWDVFKFTTEKRGLDFHKFLPKVINFLLILREFGIKFESVSSQLTLDWSILKENPLLLSVFLT